MSKDNEHEAPTDALEAEQQARQHFDEEALEGLAASIRELGFLQPIRVRKRGTRFVIVDGERRWRAACKLGLATVPIVVEQKAIGKGETLQQQLVANCQREDLTAGEKANAIKQLMEETGWTASQTASKLGLSCATVTRLLALLTLPGTIHALVEEGVIPASAAYELTQIDDPARQTELAQQLAAGELTRDGLSGARKAARRGGQGESETQPTRATALVGPSRTVTVASVGLSLERLIEVIEELLAKARRARTQGIELGTFLKMLRDQAKS